MYINLYTSRVDIAHDNDNPVKCQYDDIGITNSNVPSCPVYVAVSLLIRPHWVDLLMPYNRYRDIVLT